MLKSLTEISILSIFNSAKSSLFLYIIVYTIITKHVTKFNIETVKSGVLLLLFAFEILFITESVHPKVPFASKFSLSIISH